MKYFGFDMNDCSLDEIQFYLDHTMLAEKAIMKLSGENEDDIFFGHKIGIEN